MQNVVFKENSDSMMKNSGIFDFGSAKSSPGEANKLLDQLFPLETQTSKLNMAAQLHQAANHGTSRPSVFVVNTVIKDSEEFRTDIPQILKYVGELVTALSSRELSFQISPNEFRNFGGADVEVRTHVGVLAAHLLLGTNRMASPRTIATLFVLCNFENGEAYQSTNRLVFQIHSTPSWPTGDLNRPQFPLACDPVSKLLFRNTFHIARPESQLDSPQIIDKGSDQKVSDEDSSSFEGFETDEESEVRFAWCSENPISFFRDHILLVMLV